MRLVLVLVLVPVLDPGTVPVLVPVLVLVHIVEEGTATIDSIHSAENIYVKYEVNALILKLQKSRVARNSLMVWV